MALPRITTPNYKLKIPSTGQEVEYRPFLVKEEKILLIALESEDENQIMDAVSNIIDNCLTGDFNVRELAMFDIEYIFLQLRAKSKGEELELEISCGDCNAPIPLSVMLSDIEVQKTEGHTNKIELSNDIGVIMKYPSIDLKLKMNPDLTEMENIFVSLVNCLDSIWDKDQVYSHKDHTEQELQDFFESLPESEFDKIQKFFTTMPVLKHELDVKCTAKVDGKGKTKKSCGWKSTKVLEGLQSFFA